MADIRIKDLTTTASSTASGDFFVIDGTTGTRKVNAFNPSFGGNATVTGTLTVNGTASDLTNSNNGQTGLTVTNSNGGTSAFTKVGTWNGTVGVNLVTWGSAYTGRTNESWLYTNGLYPLKFGTDSTARMTLASTGELSISSTSASTTTSTGALVVSGGVGIAKQIVTGEDITIDPIDASPENLAPEVAFCRSASLATATSVLAFGSSSRIGLLRGYHDGADQVEWRFGSYIGTTFNEQMRLGGTSATSSSLTLYGTTASTSTSSGALVVSGGVGVGGAITLGSSLTSTASDGKISITGTGNTTGVKEIQFTRADGGDSTVLGLAGSAYAGVLTGLGNNDAYLYTSSAFAFRIFVGTSNRFDFTSSQFKINPTTASTSTSSGALVVSGGVGVGKTIRVGEEVIIDQPTANPTLLRLYSNGGNGTYTNFAESSMGGQSTNVAFLRWTRGGNEDRELSVHVSNYAGTSIKATTIDPNGNLIQRLNGTAASLATNSTMTFELTSNTSLKIFVRGSDGTTRSTTLTLA